MKWRTASRNVSRPYLEQRSLILRSPIRAAATAAHMSPFRKSGRRELAAMMSITAALGTPASTMRTAGRRSPSWKISVASVDIPPGTMPPRSFQCAMLAVQATIASSTNTGIARITSLRCVTPP